MKRGLLSVAIVAAVGWTGGCGGQSEVKPQPEPSGLSCDLTATPCGGDVVGTWKVMDCPLELTGAVDLRGFGLGCAFGETISGSLEVSGTWTADATGLFWDNTTTKGVHQFSLPEACLDVGLVADCAILERPFTNTTYATTECVDDPETGGCLCTGTFDQQGGLAAISAGPFEMGRYSVAGNRLTLGVEESGTPYDYCVTGDAMVSTLPAASTAGEVVGSLVLQKQ